MKKAQHIYLEIKKNAFQSGTLAETVDINFKLPKRVFPPSFLIRGRDFLCGGYFACYDRSVTTEEIIKFCRSGRWQFLGNLIGDFIIFYCDFLTNEVFVLTDQSGKFPCFFSLEDDRLVLSTDFEAIKNKLGSLTLDVGAAFDFVSRSILLTDETIISEIRQVPPATLLRVERNLSYSLTSLVNLDKFLAYKQPVYSSVEEFSNDFLACLQKITTERLRLSAGLTFGADISSGFDSSLICYLLKTLNSQPFSCYCGISRYTTGDTDPQIVREFAQKHKLKVRFINEDKLYPFSNKIDLRWHSRLPGQIAYGLMHNFHYQVARDHNIIEFLGEGGDEVYKSSSMDLLSPFPIQEEYFWAVKKLKLKLERVLTTKGIELLLDKVRFQKKKAFFLIIASSAILVNLELFPIFWELGIWPMTPFADPRLIQLARSIPRRGKKASTKQEIWKNHPEIFVPGQFRQKQGPVEHVRLFLHKKPKFVISILKNSLLAKKGWVRASEIASNVKAGNIQKYFDGDAVSFLLNLVKLEYFLQQNNVKIPN